MATSNTHIADLSHAMITKTVAAADWLVIAPVIIPIIFGAIILMARKSIKIQGLLATFALGLLVVSEIGLLTHVLNNGTIVMTMGRWLPPFGISFTVDALSAIFALTSGISALLVCLYSLRDITNTGRRYGFYTFLLLMMAGVSGAFLTGDIFNLYVWFEVLLISSFGLLILGSRHEQLDGASKYALLNLVATTIFLIATGLLYGAFGTLNMADLGMRITANEHGAPIMTIAALYFLAFGMKAAAFPVNFWLPASYHTPRIVVGAIFAGLLTKVGIYAVLRVGVMLFAVARDHYGFMLAIVASATMILGVLGALAQSEIRKIMGYVVITGIGTMFAGIALASPLALSGTIFYALHSMLVMTALYLLVGLIELRTGSSNLHQAAGLYSRYPLMAAGALILFFAAAGLPPFSGIWPKIFIVKAGLDVGAWWLIFALLFSALLTTIVLGRVFALVFWRNNETQEGENLERVPYGLGDFALWSLIVPIVGFGLYPTPIMDITNIAAQNILDMASYSQSVFPNGAGQ